MTADDAVVLDILRRCMVARIATLSRSGRPSVNPLYFIYLHGKIWLGTPEWTLAARNVKANPRVSVLFNVEQDPGDRRVLRISGQARVRTDIEAQRSYNPRVARKYVLTPSGIINWLTHPRQLWMRRYYTAQSAQKGVAGVIEVTPELIELVTNHR
ncbi:MAG: pyridoxamine 5'-phosphate oxidase family protein [Anaerolineaceae bacterium]|nr:pyridoxamine 5'-phosphate oxidase family protein [Anaerolineaceae bacterium]